MKNHTIQAKTAVGTGVAILATAAVLVAISARSNYNAAVDSGTAFARA